MPPTQMRQQSDAILYGCQRTITAQAAFSHALNELVFNHLFQRFGSLGEPQVSGYIISQNYKEGSVVPKGQVLFEIDPRPFKATLDRAKGELGQAEAQLGKSTLDVNRDAPLVARKAVPKEQLDTEIQPNALLRLRSNQPRPQWNEQNSISPGPRLLRLSTVLQGVPKFKWAILWARPRS